MTTSMRNVKSNAVPLVSTGSGFTLQPHGSFRVARTILAELSSGRAEICAKLVFNDNAEEKYGIGFHYYPMYSTNTRLGGDDVCGKT